MERLEQGNHSEEKKMKNDEKAKIILEHLEKYLQVNWAFEEFYIKGIMNGLREIDKQEAAKGEMNDSQK